MSAIAQLAAMLDTNAALDCGLDGKQTEVAALQCELAGKQAEVATAHKQAANLQQQSDQLQRQVAHLTHESTMLQDSMSKQAADNAKALQVAPHVVCLCLFRFVSWLPDTFQQKSPAQADKLCKASADTCPELTQHGSKQSQVLDAVNVDCVSRLLGMLSVWPFNSWVHQYAPCLVL